MAELAHSRTQAMLNAFQAEYNRRQAELIACAECDEIGESHLTHEFCADDDSYFMEQYTIIALNPDFANAWMHCNFHMFQQLASFLSGGTGILLSVLKFRWTLSRKATSSMNLRI